MLQIEIPITSEGYDEETNMFVDPETVTLQLEHSLVSLSRWESKWCKPFLSSSAELSEEETLDYIKCMTLTHNVDPDVYNHLSRENIEQINQYISAPMTATTFYDDKQNGKGRLNRETVTAELVYYWMIALQIPFECQNWHLNRLLTLVRVCNVKNEPPKKRSKRDIMSRNAALNAARRKQMGTTG